MNRRGHHEAGFTPYALAAAIVALAVRMLWRRR